MKDIFVNIHRAEIFEGFILQSCFSWDIKRPADIERIKQWKGVFDNAYDDAYDDVSGKRVGADSSESYIKCREYICKHW